MKLSSTYLPGEYWGSLIVGKQASDVDEVGHPDMGREFNLLAYRLRIRALKKALSYITYNPQSDGVFEAAFGVGAYLKYWSRLGCKRVVGVDLSKQTVENVQGQFPQFDLRHGDLAAIHKWTEWDRLRNAFGVVTAIDVLYHIVDDAAAIQALDNLAQLLAPAGSLLLTEKFPAGSEPVQEWPHVRRRPKSWYEAHLAKRGIIYVKSIPVFWCMDPPIFNGGQKLFARMAYCGWGALRMGVKPWGRNSTMQNIVGRIMGRAGLYVDEVITSCCQTLPNLSLAVYRKAID